MAPPRLLPLLCVAATLLLTVKVGAIVANVLAVTEAQARPRADAPPPPPVLIASAAPPKDAPPPSPPPVVTPRPGPAAPAGSAELEALQLLAARRADLDRQAEELGQREAILRAAEQRIDEKIAKIQEVETRIGESFKRQEEADETRMKSLVRIYEAMKPKEAARIFEELDLPVLLGVVERMKEMKSAPILAAMEPLKAKTVTTALAERRSAGEPPKR